MMDNIYEKILHDLKTDGVILEELLPSSDTIKFSPERVIQILEATYKLVYDEDSDELKFIDNNGEETIAPDLSDGITPSSTWLCDKVPVPILDFNQGGNVRRSNEAKSIYTLICIGIVFKNFKSEIKTAFKEYYFKDFSFKSSDAIYETMLEYLGTFKNLNFIRMNVVISAASIKISNAIEKKDSYWKSQLTL